MVLLKAARTDNIFAPCQQVKCFARSCDAFLRLESGIFERKLNRKFNVCNTLSPQNSKDLFNDELLFRLTGTSIFCSLVSI